MKKIFKSILKSFIFASFAFIFALFTSTPFAFAVDLTVTCNNEGPCDMAPVSGKELFFEENILPGYSVTRQITIINNDNDDDCPVILNTKNEQDNDNLASALFTVIKDGANDLYGVSDGSQASSNKDLDDVFLAGDISLGTVAHNSSKVYEWTVTFDPLAGNEYQNTQTVFDFDLPFSCGTAPSPSSSPTASSSPGPGGSPGPGPSASPASPSPFSAGFGLPLFGGAGAVAGAAIEEVLLESPLPSVEGIIASPSPQVKGEKTECLWWNYPWWLPLVIQALLTWIYYYWLKNKKVTAWWLPPVLMALLSQLIHEILGCWCTDSKWCPWYWLFNLIIFICLTSYYYYRRKKESSDLTTN